MDARCVLMVLWVITGKMHSVLSHPATPTASKHILDPFTHALLSGEVPAIHNVIQEHKQEA